ncbi:MAG: sulfatase [Verrucomicrobiaceae bacterium]|nr:sulfatase [Verrucomicrobiaceae bacterium]
MKHLVALLAVFVGITHASTPNIVFVLADDLGYGDLHCFGAKDVQTPNLDKFASEGLKLTNCYAAHANCSPSRTAIITGRTPTRVGVRDWIPEESPVHLRRSEITIATLLHNAGYATAHVGKWHLNGEFNQPTQPQPGDHGFDHWFSTHNNAYPNHRNPDNFVRNGKEVGKTQGFASQLVADEAIHWLRDIRDKSKPFFLYVCFHEPHEPIATADEYKKLYPSDDKSFTAHHGNITQMDANFGRLMRALDDDKLRDNTFVMFTSDNGPAITPFHPHGSAGPLRDKKGSMYEGGIRIPGLVRWLGQTKPGSVSDEPVCGVDVLPTLCAAANIAPPNDRKLDGTSFLPVLAGESLKRSTPLYWHFNRASSAMKIAIRVGDWKLLAALDKNPEARDNNITVQSERDFKTAEPTTFELYNLKTDLTETTNLIDKEPAKFTELKAALLAKYHEVRDDSPTWPAWKFTSAEGKKIIWEDTANGKK